MTLILMQVNSHHSLDHVANGPYTFIFRGHTSFPPSTTSILENPKVLHPSNPRNKSPLPHHPCAGQPHTNTAAAISSSTSKANVTSLPLIQDTSTGVLSTNHQSVEIVYIQVRVGQSRIGSCRHGRGRGGIRDYGGTGDGKELVRGFGGVREGGKMVFP